MQTKNSLMGRSMRPFWFLWSGQAISLLGSQVVQFALIWWLTQQTGSARVLAGATLVGMLPQIVLGPFVGVLVDRWNRRLIMLVADSLTAAATLLLVFLFASGVVQVWHIYLIMFARSLGGAFHFSSMASSTTLMVAKEHLPRVQGFNQMLQGGMNIASAPLGALMLSLWPMQQVLMLDVITALFAVIPLFFIAIPQPVKKVSEVGAAAVKPSFFRELRAGLAYVWHWPALMLLMAMAMSINFLLTPTSSLTPLLVTQHFQGTAWHLGGLEAVWGIGVIIGGLGLGVWGGFRSKIVTSMTGLLFIGLGVAAMGLAPSHMFPLALVSMAVLGIAIPMTNGPIFAIFQSQVAPEMQGRVFSLIGSLSAAMAPLGLLIAGPVADALGIRFWYVLGGGVTLLMGMVGLTLPLLRQLDGDKEAQEKENAAAPLSSEEPAEGMLII
ncbi:MAG: MFS transporter [Anaerolineae bacterium]|nr:MFS transporter [Anaerolineae bacterium]